MRKSTYQRHILAATLSSIGLFVLLLSGCSNGAATVEKARNLNISSDNVGFFEAALANEYRTLALFEADQMGDNSDASGYAEKAIEAAAGAAPEPDRLRSRILPEETLKEVRPLRKRLINAAGHKTSPISAARAQASFDCWVEQLEEGFQEDDIAACKKRFLNALMETEAVLPDTFITFFGSDSAKLNDDGVDAAVHAARIVKDADGLAVFLRAHADREGGREHNQRLSERRARAVKDQLVKGGVDPDHIRTAAFGETRPLVDTPDGVPEQKNRRVEISISLEPKEYASRIFVGQNGDGYE
jgi:OmpA-OmpF porin, OOP family